MQICMPLPITIEVILFEWLPVDYIEAFPGR